jgi:DNA-binding response OmpR family regulator
MPDARILVVDDEDLVRDYFDNALTAGGYQVDLAATAERAYALLAERDYALVIADWWLDDGNGLSIANEAASRGAKTCVSSGFELELLGENAERHRLIRKPVSPADLLAAVRGAIGDPGITRIGARPETLR